MDEISREIPRQCTAHNRVGERCQKSAMVGQQVCHFHGGKNPGALRRARERLLALAEPALDGLLRALESNDLPAIVSAARVVLDRAGLGPSAHLTVEPVVGDVPCVEWLTTEELQVLDDLLGEAKRRKLAGEPKLNDRVLRVTTVERVIIDATTPVEDVIKRTNYVD